MSNQNQKQGKQGKKSSPKQLASQIAALMNQVHQLQTAADKNSGQAKASKVARKNKNRSAGQNPPKNQTFAKEAGNAVLITLPRIGLKDLMSHSVSWVCGSVYVGNGTLGATNSVYFQTATGTYDVCGIVPILGADAQVGASFIAAIDQLYRRKRIRKLCVHFFAIQSSTTNNLTLTAAPMRGPPGQTETGKGKTDTTAAITQLVAMSLQGAKTCDSFQNMSLDLTPYIAGGSGSQQNEFAVSNAASAATSPITLAQNLLGICPASFIVAGTSTVAALQGTNTHYVVVEEIRDLLDFVGAETVLAPED